MVDAVVVVVTMVVAAVEEMAMAVVVVAVVMVDTMYGCRNYPIIPGEIHTQSGSVY